MKDIEDAIAELKEINSDIESLAIKFRAMIEKDIKPKKVSFVPVCCGRPWPAWYEYCPKCGTALS